ncbi:MAG: hypothetical protein QM669_08765 [Siphonobacter sp.]
MMDLEKKEEGLPPFVRSWRQLYGIVIANLFLIILLFWWFTEALS